MTRSLTRRKFAALAGAGAGLLTVAQKTALAQQSSPVDAAESLPGTPSDRRILKSLKWGMIGGELSPLEKFQLIQELGFDGVEVDSPGGVDKQQALAASQATGLPIDGSVDSTHWQTRLTDPDETRREAALQDLLTALRETRMVGGHSVLLVPGHGKDGSKAQLAQRSQQLIGRALPTAARLGVFILIENVWNEMFYDKDGDDQQSADELAEYVDALNSPWVGVQFDIGNHQKYGSPAGWIRTLGRRIVKLDVKDWGRSAGFCKIGAGDVDWAAVRDALDEINFSGWAAAEVTGGGRERLADVSRRMDDVLGLAVC